MRRVAAPAWRSAGPRRSRGPTHTGALRQAATRRRPGLAFNVSHCDGTALISLAAGCDVGVDVEAPRHVREPRRVAHRMFARSEAKVIAELGPELAAAAFLRCWTAKEAVLKALGIGLAGRLDEVVVDARPHVPLRLRGVPGPRLASDWTLHAVELPQGLVGALALAAPALPAVAVRRFTAGEAARRLSVRWLRRRAPRLTS